MIRRRLMLIAVPLGVVFIAASVAFASTDTEHTGDAKLDKLHAERPIAAPHTLFPSGYELGLNDVTASLAELNAALSSPPPAVTSEAPPEPPPAALDPAPPVVVASSVSAPSDSSGALACIRAHESDSAGGYQAVSAGGTYRGAYQFLQSTWDSTAAAAGRGDLVGIDPATASPGDQDAIAAYLYSQSGDAPWGNRCA